MSETTTIKLLDTLKGKGYSSDYQIGNALGTSRQVVSRWRQKKGQMDADLAAKAAELAGTDPAATVAQIEAERAQSPKARNLFEQLHDAAELVDMIKRTPALKATLAENVRQFAQTIENEEERARFLSNPFFKCILCYIPKPIRHSSCSKPKPARKPFPVVTIARKLEFAR